MLIGGGSGTCCLTFMAEDTLSQSSSQHTSRFGNARFVPATAKPKAKERLEKEGRCLVGGIRTLNWFRNTLNSVRWAPVTSLIYVRACAFSLDAPFGSLSLPPPRFSMSLSTYLTIKGNSGLHIYAQSSSCLKCGFLRKEINKRLDFDD